MDRPIVIVEDDNAIRESLEELLTSEGYSVRTACHGGEGLTLIEQFSGKCLVLLDLQMPVMNGEQLLDALSVHPNPEISKTPVIVLTARGEPLRRTVAGFIRKPLNVDELLRTIAFLGMSGTEA